MSRRANGDVRRAEIAGALLRVMARHGYEGATVQRIATEAGLAPGLVHYHFGSKRDVLVHLVQSMADAAKARFQEVLGSPAPADERMRRYLDARLGLRDDSTPDVVAAWVMIGAEAVRQPEVRELYQELVKEELELLTELFARWLDERGADTAHAARWAAGLQALIEGAFQLSSAAGDVMPRGYAAPAAWAFANGAVEATASATIRRR